MSARRNLVFLLPLGLFMGIAVTACGLVAGLEDNVEIEATDGGATNASSSSSTGTSGGGMGGMGGAGAMGGMGGIGVGVGGACDIDGGVVPGDLIPGFMDARDVPCSDGTQLVDCTCVPPGFHGQDAEFLGIVPTFQSVGPNEVMEAHTGLTWWTIPTENANFTTAQSICASLGQNYRLPTRLELWTIIEHNQIGDTLLDETIFTGIQPGLVWTSTSYVHDNQPNSHWVIDTCSKCPSSSASYGRHESIEATVLCVNGNEVKNGPFTDQMNGTLLDEKTRLIWFSELTPTPDNYYDWKEALDFCEKSFLGGKTDWRLPTIKELQTILDTTKTGKTSLYDGFVLGADNEPTFWSSTPDWTGARFYQLVSAGGSTTRGNENYMYATCVRRED